MIQLYIENNGVPDSSTAAAKRTRGNAVELEEEEEEEDADEDEAEEDASNSNPIDISAVDNVFVVLERPTIELEDTYISPNNDSTTGRAYKGSFPSVVDESEETARLIAPMLALLLPDEVEVARIAAAAAASSQYLENMKGFAAS